MGRSQRLHRGGHKHDLWAVSSRLGRVAGGGGTGWALALSLSLSLLAEMLNWSDRVSLSA